MAYTHSLRRYAAVSLLAAGLLLTPAVARADDAAWQPPADGGFSAFLTALGKERYMSLVYRRMTRDLRAGDANAACVVLLSYLRHRDRLQGEGPGVQPPDRVSVEADIASGIQTGRGAVGLTVPEELDEAVLRLATETADAVFAEREASGFLASSVCRQSPLRRAGTEVPRTDRVENSGLLSDARDFVRQPHLRYLAHLQGPAETAFLIGELLRIGHADGLAVDAESAAIFVDRLVADGVIAADAGGDVLVRLLEVLFAEGGNVENSETVPGPETELQERETDAEQEAAEAEQDVTDADQDIAAAEEAPGDTGELERDDPLVVADGGSTASGNGSDISTGGAVSQAVERGARADALLVLEGGFGGNLPTGRVALSPSGQSLERRPSLAARLSLGLVWPEAVGSADLGLHLVGVAARGPIGSMRGVAPGGGLAGSDSYYGIMPYLTLERAITADASVRLGGGVGLALRDVSASAAGVSLADAQGSALLVQAGLGFRYRLSGCMDAGVDLYGTYVGKVTGSAVGAQRRFEGFWDIALLFSVRAALAQFGRTGIEGAVSCP